MEYPRISIITPSYNQGLFLEKTILSVINQKYPNLEYIIMDGGSTDNSPEIIKKYTNYLTFWQSKPDNGQADAIFNGFNIATGDIITYINSDDYYLDGALHTIADIFLKNPSLDWIVGNAIIVDEKNQELLRCYSTNITFERLLYQEALYVQPSIFFTRKAFFSCGGFDRNLVFCFDYDLFLNLSMNSSPLLISNFLSAFRYHPNSKTSTIPEVSRYEANYIRNEKYKAYKKSIYYTMYRLKRRHFVTFIHRLKTSGIIPYFLWCIKMNPIIHYLKKRN